MVDKSRDNTSVLSGFSGLLNTLICLFHVSQAGSTASVWEIVERVGKSLSVRSY